jgi:hypothetical protein
MRPRQVRRLLALMWFGAVLIFAVALITLPKSYASPGQCGQGFGFDEHVAEALALIDFDRWERECGGRK